MKYLKIFSLSIILFVGCQNPEEEEIDLDQMVLSEEESDDHLAGDPQESPQEILIKESPSIE